MIINNETVNNFNNNKKDAVDWIINGWKILNLNELSLSLSAPLPLPAEDMTHTRGPPLQEHVPPEREVVPFDYSHLMRSWSKNE